MADYTGEDPLTTEQLVELRARLQKMKDPELQSWYEACLQMCRLDRGRPPRATYVQQLVQGWRELQRRHPKN